MATTYAGEFMPTPSLHLKQHAAIVCAGPSEPRYTAPAVGIK